MTPEQVTNTVEFFVRLGFVVFLFTAPILRRIFNTPKPRWKDGNWKRWILFTVWGHEAMYLMFLIVAIIVTAIAHV